MKKGHSVELPDNIDDLKELVLALTKNNEFLKSDNTHLRERVTLLERHIFARKSEKITVEDRRQMVLFDEAESGADDETINEIDQDKNQTIKRSSKKKGRKPLPADIPRERVIHDLDPKEKKCSCCGNERPVMPSEISEELIYIPAQIRVLEHEKVKYGPCSCKESRDSEESPIITAKAPPRIMPGSIASASLLAFIITGKYCDSLPFYRHERIFKRLGIDISRTNMCNWAIKTASKCSDLIDLMRDKTREGPLINMDETTVQVLKEKDKKVDSKSYMWVTVGSDSGHKIVLYNYSRTRKAQVAVDLLEGFTGSLQTDGYAGYNDARKEYGLWHIGCLAHLRRKFIEAAKATKSGGQANKALKYISKIYRIEKELRSRELSPEKFVETRRKEVIPVFREFHKWLIEKKAVVVPSSALGRAIRYALGEYMKVVRYMKYEYLSPDNNVAENSIRPFVLGRKNWLFSDTPRGAHASATLYSLVETARANGVEPMDYLHKVFEKLPAVENKMDLEKLLPWNISIPKK